MTNDQMDAVAARIAARLIEAIDAHCPPPKGVSCKLCAGNGFTMVDGEAEFCFSCEAGKIARRRQAILNYMVCQGGAAARKAEKERILPKEYDPRKDPDHPMNKFT